MVNIYASCREILLYNIIDYIVLVTEQVRFPWSWFGFVEKKITAISLKSTIQDEMFILRNTLNKMLLNIDTIADLVEIFLSRTDDWKF